MTTTESARSSPKRVTGGPNLRLSLTTLLASVYVLAWWTFGTRAPARRAEFPPFDAATDPGARQAVVRWYDDLVPSARPRVQIPAGWHLAERATASPLTAAPTVPARVSPARPGRMRTRSS